MFIEVSGSPSKPDEKHIKDDAEKLLKEATFGLVSLLRNYLDKPAEMAKNVHIYRYNASAMSLLYCSISLGFP